MNGIKTQLRRFNFRLKHDFFTVENVVILLAIILCLTWTYQSITAMTRNWELTERLATERANLELVKVEVETAELENEYYRSEEYQELLARKYLDKMLPGENLVILPENSEAAKNKHALVSTSEKTTESAEEPSNFEKWRSFLFPEV